MRRKTPTTGRDPYEIRALAFDGTCAETGKPLKKGQPAIYYPATRQLYHPDSQQATEFRQWKADQQNGFNY